MILIINLNKNNPIEFSGKNSKKTEVDAVRLPRSSLFIVIGVFNIFLVAKRIK